MRVSTKQEAINGNSNDTFISPLRLKQVLDTVDITPGEGGGGSGSDAPVYTAGAGISITNNVITNTITKTSQLTNDSNFITAEDIPDFPEVEQKEEVIISSSKPTNGEDIWIQDSANLFIPNKTNIGYKIKSDGSLSYEADSRYFINDYLEIEPNTIYTFGEKRFGSGYHAWYDADKNFISTVEQINNKVTTVTSPSNAKYIRLSLFEGYNWYDNDMLTFQFVKGTTLPPYDKYVDGTRVYAKKADGTYEEIYNSKETSGSYTLTPATSSTLGGIKVGDNLTITDDGTLSAVVSPGGGDNTDIDTVPINSIFGYEGDDVPDGFIELSTTPDGDIVDLNDYVKKDELKTVNGQELFGEGDIVIEGGSGDGDSVPINAIFDYEGDTVPEGYIKVEPSTDDGGNTSLVYSTTETIIGTWIDGRPIYQKTFEFEINTTDYRKYLKDCGITNVQNVWIDESASFFRYTQYTENGVQGVNTYLSSSDWRACYIDADQRLTLRNSINSSVYWTVTLRYTKKTD